MRGHVMMNLRRFTQLELRIWARNAHRKYNMPAVTDRAIFCLCPLQHGQVYRQNRRHRSSSPTMAPIHFSLMSILKVYARLWHAQFAAQLRRDRFEAIRAERNRQESR
jgi:hypothetical protein